MPTSSARPDRFPLADADSCVKCGLCLPHCPTYKLSRDENESPRGRIALMQGVVTEQLGATPKLAAHLDRCLSCRACEPVCPAQVPYGRLIDAARHELRRRGNRENWRARLLRVLAPRRGLWRLTGFLTRVAQRAGAGGLLPQLPRLAPPRYRAGQTFAADGPERGRVALFLGCAADPFDARVQHAAIEVLTRLGFTVALPAGQTCCGALHWHAGDRTRARRLAAANLAAFPPDMPVLSTATGCGAHLAEYHEVTDAGESLARRVQDINTFLANLDWPTGLRLRPHAESIAVQIPCTQRNVLRQPDSVTRLLARIPGLEAVPLAHRDCCGAAGSYFLNQPGYAGRLADAAMHAIRQSSARTLATANIGCAMQLRAACRRAGLDIAVRHPLEILAGQLDELADHPHS